MNNKNLHRKAQSLPLNTIVIAILVILVLLVIIVFFTSNVGESGETLNQVSGCNLNNPVLSSIGVQSAVPSRAVNPSDPTDGVCQGDARVSSLVPRANLDDGTVQYCCVTGGNN